MRTMVDSLIELNPRWKIKVPIELIFVFDLTGKLDATQKSWRPNPICESGPTDRNQRIVTEYDFGAAKV